MNVLVDTNVLVALAQPSHVGRSAAVTARAAIEAAGHFLCVVPQNLYEFWVVATRPITNGGLGLTPDECKVEADGVKAAFTLLRDPPDLLERWEDLVVRYQCRGKPAHDARLGAAMLGCGIGHVLTFNGKDFTRFANVRVVDPSMPVV